MLERGGVTNPACKVEIRLENGGLNGPGKIQECEIGKLVGNLEMKKDGTVAPSKQNRLVSIIRQD